MHFPCWCFRLLLSILLLSFDLLSFPFGIPLVHAVQDADCGKQQEKKADEHGRLEACQNSKIPSAVFALAQELRLMSVESEIEPLALHQNAIKCHPHLYCSTT